MLRGMIVRLFLSGILSVFLSLAATTCFAEAQALFHPTDPSLNVIAGDLRKATSNIDIAMYSMDVSDDSPVVMALKSEPLTSRIHNGSLHVRVIFEGYGSDEDNTAHSEALEQLGVDVRWFSSGRKVHHKFAVIDGDQPSPTLITGSANWSLGSMKNYDEAIMVFRGEPGISQTFQKEFNLLWGLSSEYGVTRFPETITVGDAPMEPGVSVAFNTANFKITGSRLTAIEPKVWTLTHAIVVEIDAAQTSLKIASTRIVLRPIYNAILRAAARGVKIDILVNEDQYELPNVRLTSVLADCADEYDDSCSKNIDFPWFLESLSYPGRENVTVHVKFFSLNTRVTLAKQMHAKYVVTDDNRVASGSFNWSSSSEYDNIENVVKLVDSDYHNVITAFSDNHARIFSRGRDQYAPYIQKIETAITTGVKTDCAFAPMALTYKEIDYLLDSGQRAGHKPFKDACL